MSNIDQHNHWSERSVDDFVYRITSDFTVQVEDTLTAGEVTKADLASQLGISKGRVSQVLNRPHGLSLKNVVRYARAIHHKVAIVLYDDNDHLNLLGPINSEIFSQCWQRMGRPRDFFDLNSAITKQTVVVMLTTNGAHKQSMWSHWKTSSNPPHLNADDSLFATNEVATTSLRQ